MRRYFFFQVLKSKGVLSAYRLVCGGIIRILVLSSSKDISDR